MKQSGRRGAAPCLDDAGSRAPWVAAMQMGPAFLPTPLSPARGLPPVFRPEAVLFRKRLAPDVFPRARRPAFCHRRSHRHPVPSLEGPALQAEACVCQPWAPSISPQPFDPLMAVPSGSLWPKPPFPFIPDRSLPAVSANFRILVIGWACVWPKPFASNPRKSRGQSLPHRLFWKSSGFSILSDENPGGFPSLSMD